MIYARRNRGSRPCQNNLLNQGYVFFKTWQHVPGLSYKWTQLGWLNSNVRKFYGSKIRSVEIGKPSILFKRLTVIRQEYLMGLLYLASCNPWPFQFSWNVTAAVFFFFQLKKKKKKTNKQTNKSKQKIGLGIFFSVHKIC